MAGSNLWYSRRRGEVKGPFPSGLISRYILLGRIQLTDEVSENGQDWLLVTDVPALIPKLLKGDISDSQIQERLQAARRWADERDRRRDNEQGDHEQRREGRRDAARRENGEPNVVKNRLNHFGREKEISTDLQNRWTMMIIVGVVAVAAGLFTLHNLPPSLSLSVDCRSHAAPHVNWNNCVMDGASLDERDLSGASLYSTSLTGASLRHSTLRGANLSYAGLSISNMEDADLRQAKLVGANLRRARLVNALLDDANLSYADLTDADLTGVSLRNTKLGNVIWSDGKHCLPQSIGSCQTAQ